MQRRGVVRVIFLYSIAAGLPARAAIENANVKAGVAAQDDLECGRAIELLHKALTEKLTSEEKVAAHVALGFCHVAIGAQDSARADFENLLAIEPGYVLDRSVSPKVRAVFEQARARRAATAAAPTPEPAPAPATPAVPPRHVYLDLTPKSPQAGQPVTAAAYLPGGHVATLHLYYRTKRSGTAAGFSSVQSEGHLGRFSVTIPGMQVESPGLEYYAVGLDDAGATVAVEGSREQPLALAVTDGKPVYARPWLWVGLGGAALVLGGAAAVIAVFATRPDANAPGHVTIAPQ